ncbi:hypothetical protein NP233_g9771 [Leucocoprinus birnbaumii]|uniref:ABC transmembrane type-1 domain-containing protein n=1 Tax=Leucocoprinus birnbaumii TaxID=56174 RepID=A0AAD5YQI8_9AGAR|nr:hypothetical protein NP233_g9771 [Leucocoprinus birnbaumii]
MSDSRPSTADEKATVVETKASRGFFRKKNKEAKDVEKTEESTPEVPKAEEVTPVGFFEMFRFATRFETTINLLSLIAAAAAGAAQPLMTLLFGNLTQDFVAFQTVLNSNNPDAVPAAADHFRRDAALNASYLTYIGVGMFVCTYIYMFTWVYTGEINAKRVRERYLQAVLRQDIQYFDKVGAGEVATRIQTDTHLVQQGTSEKVALVVNFLSAFVTGFILAYARSWRLALAMSSILPCIGITGGVMNKFISTYMQYVIFITISL